jgi:hypothetical protein
MGPHRDDSHDRPYSPLGLDVAAHVEAIVHAAEREARTAERAIEERRRSAEAEVGRYLAAARLRVDAEAAARAAKIEALGTAVRRLTDELTDATAALNAELRRSEEELEAAVPRAPWPAAASAASPAAQPTWARTASVPPPAADGRDAAPDGLVAAAPADTAARASVPPPTGTAAPAGDAPADVSNAARLVAIEMAVGGSSRADVERHLRTGFGVSDPAPLLDDVFGSESHAGSRLAWGEP